MRRKSGINDYEDEKYFPIRPFQLWVILTCGIIITLIGVYLQVEGETIGGKAYSNGRSGPAAGTLIILNGPVLTAVGLTICIFPGYQLIKQTKRRKNVE